MSTPQVRLKPDAPYLVRLKPDAPYLVRLKPDARSYESESRIPAAFLDWV